MKGFPLQLREVNKVTKAMRLEDQSLSSSSLSKERGEMVNIEDRLGASGIDSASRSGMSSKPD